MFIQAGRQENNPSPGSAILAYFQSSHPKLLGQRQRPFTHGTGSSISTGMSTVASCGPRPHEGHRGHRWTPVLHWTELQERNTEPGNPRLFNKKSATLLFVLKGDITSPVTVAYCKHNWKNCVGLEWSEPCIVDCLPQQYMSLARLRFLHEYPILSKFSKPGFSNM